jgi:hypothetical protein
MRAESGWVIPPSPVRRRVAGGKGLGAPLVDQVPDQEQLGRLYARRIGVRSGRRVGRQVSRQVIRGRRFHGMWQARAHWAHDGLPS